MTRTITALLATPLATPLAVPLAVTLAAGLALGAAAPAHAARGNEALRRTCSGDMATFCGDLDPGSRQMEACFRKHRRELSPACGRAIDAYRAKGGR